jgi:hypothetical protein
MEKEKPITPYQRLMTKARGFSAQVLYPEKKTMWHYPKAKLSIGWSLADLWERTAAAEQVGYDVRLKATDAGLVVEYVKRPEVPFGLA